MSKLLNDDESERVLNRILTCFSSCYGPNGRLKLIENLDRSMNVYASRSFRLFDALKTRHFISRMLLAMIGKQMKRFHDGGFYFALLFGYFLKEMRRSVDNEEKNLTIFRAVLDLVDRIEIESENVDFQSVGPLLALVRAVFSKPFAFNYSNFHREQLCLLSVKSFLENTDEKLVLTIEGLNVDDPTMVDGLLYETNSSKEIFLSDQIDRPCLLFTVSLAGDYQLEHLQAIETCQDQFQWIQTVAERIVQQILSFSQLHGVGIIFCQKVIHPSIKIQLKRYQIETFDRLGRTFLPHFSYLTDCQPIETLTFDMLDQRYFGRITQIKRVNIGKKHFLQFINSNRPFHTVLLTANNEQTLTELKDCFTASQHVLTDALTSRKAFCGAGCLESAQILFLHSQTNSMAGRILIRTLTNLLRSLYTELMVIDRIHGHLWFLSDDDQLTSHCACQLYHSTDSFKAQWKSLIIDLDHSSPLENSSISSERFFVKEKSPQYLDSFSMKNETFQNAIETAINLQLTNVSLE